MKYLFVTMFTLTAFAEEIIPPMPEDWGKIVVDLTKGELSILALVAAGVQCLMLLARSPLGEKSGRFRLLVVSGLSLVGGVVGLMTQGMAVGSALAHSSTLAALQVFGFELYKKLVVEKQPQQVVPNEQKEPKRKEKKK